MDIALPENGSYKVELIDTWEMTRSIAFDSAKGRVHLKMPGKERIAILVTRLSGDSL
jgi:hypothetical protein